MARARSSLVSLLDSYVKRPSSIGGSDVLAGAGDLLAANALRKPLMSFLGEASKPQGPSNDIPIIRPEHSRQDHPARRYGHHYGYVPEMGGPERSRRQTTGFEYRPFSEPDRQPDRYEDWE